MNTQAASASSLSSLAGAWAGVARTWFEPGKLADESRWEGVIREIVPGRFFLHEYSSTAPEGSKIGELHGAMLLGYEKAKDRFVCHWVDSFHMSAEFMTSTGERTESGFSVLGHYPAPEGPDWGWRTDFALESSNFLRVTMHNITPDGQASKAVEVEYRRR